MGYALSVWPSSDSGDNEGDQSKEIVPSDYDSLKAKFYDITLSDKTEYDEKAAVIVSDLIEIIRQIKELAPKYMDLDKKNEFAKELQIFLDSNAQSKGRDGRARTYTSLLNGRFKILGDVVRIELKEDRDSISNKAFDLSTTTVENLISQGEKDTKDILQRMS